MRTEFVYGIVNDEGLYLADRYHQRTWTPLKSEALFFKEYEVAAATALAWKAEVTGWMLVEITRDGETLW